MISRILVTPPADTRDRRHALLVAGEVAGCSGAFPAGDLPGTPRIGIWRLRRGRLGCPHQSGRDDNQREDFGVHRDICSARDLITQPHVILIFPAAGCRGSLGFLRDQCSKHSLPFAMGQMPGREACPRPAQADMWLMRRGSDLDPKRHAGRSLGLRCVQIPATCRCVRILIARHVRGGSRIVISGQSSFHRPAFS